jgi:ATPase subunit of ABC transporter with duplicated ATPase domains
VPPGHCCSRTTLLAGEELPHDGSARLGARVVPGMFAQTHTRPDLAGRTPVEIVMTEHARLMTEAMKALARYELHKCARQPFGTLSGGQQARLQILLLELGGATLLLLDEPTDNLDLPSADALQAGLEAYQGTVLAVTPRPLVRRVVRPLPGLRPRRHGEGVPGPGLGLRPSSRTTAAYSPASLTISRLPDRLVGATSA